MNQPSNTPKSIEKMTQQEFLTLVKKFNDTRNEIEDYFKGSKDNQGKRTGGIEEIINDLIGKREILPSEEIISKLSASYKKAAKRHRKSAIFYSAAILAVAVLFFVSLLLMVMSVGEEEIILDVQMLYILVPTTLVSLWITSFFGKKQREERRMEEEYTHKDMMTTAFEGYKREIERLGKEDNTQKLLLMLYQSIIKNVDYNPSQNIGKYDNEHPILSILKSNKGNNTS